MSCESGHVDWEACRPPLGGGLISVALKLCRDPRECEVHEVHTCSGSKLHVCFKR